jgi:hypothetical protein
MDLDAEREVIVGMWNGFWPTATIDSSDFYATVHRTLVEVLSSARDLGINPTIGLVLRGLAALGVRAPRIEAEVRALLEGDVVALEPDAAAHRVRRCAWRRRTVQSLDRLRVLLNTSTTTDAQVEAALDGFVAHAAAMPEATEEARVA